VESVRAGICGAGTSRAGISKLDLLNVIKRLELVDAVTADNAGAKKSIGNGRTEVLEVEECRNLVTSFAG